MTGMTNLNIGIIVKHIKDVRKPVTNTVSIVDVPYYNHISIDLHSCTCPCLCIHKNDIVCIAQPYMIEYNIYRIE